jgi:two-component system, OmpR family, response regulator
MRILIAEDDNILADGLSRSLRRNGYAVDAVGDGTAADLALSSQDFDLLILDLGLPQLAGLEVLRRLRARQSLRGAGGGSALIRHGKLVFDQTGRVASVDDQALDLSAREVSLLEILLARVGRMVSKNQLVDHLCEWGEEVSTNAIEVYVHRLRKKLEPSGVKIVTVRGLGYCVEREQSVAQSAH